jgi:hypothetical protein
MVSKSNLTFPLLFSKPNICRNSSTRVPATGFHNFHFKYKIFSKLKVVLLYPSCRTIFVWIKLNFLLNQQKKTSWYMQTTDDIWYGNWKDLFCFLFLFFLSYLNSLDCSFCLCCLLQTSYIYFIPLQNLLWVGSDYLGKK